jgi:lipopolysaccharide transport system ATP-binding protein
MRHAEIARKFDEIVSFAEVERFIDTPVKHYSSGMYVRLAFAVAAHLEPEILVVDEVLAVGDAEFQAKCLGKMKDVAQGGRTVLFVSHNMAAVQALCTQAVLLEKGAVKFSGAVPTALELYLKRPSRNVCGDLSTIQNRKGVGDIRFSRLTLTDASGDVRESGVTGELLRINLQFSCKNPDLKMRVRIGVAFRSFSQAYMFICSPELTMDLPPQIGDGDTMICSIPRLPLGGGTYGLELFLERGGVVQDFIEDGLSLSVDDRSFLGKGKNSPRGWEGSTVLVEHDWQQA